MRIANWDKFFENNRSRGLKHLTWVPMPNTHDGEKYAVLMEHKNAPEIFAAWVLMVQVASRCDDRGTLMRGDGTPHDAKSLSRKTRLPERCFVVAFDVLSQLGWIEGVTDNPAGGCQNPAGECLEGKGREGNRRRREEGDKSPTNPRKKFIKPTPDEVEEYGRSIGFSVVGKKFCDHYAQSGWKLKGGNPMKDWRAAVRTWKNNGHSNGETREPWEGAR